MRKSYYFIFTTLMISLIVCMISATTVKAADEYSFELNYSGNIVLNEEKNATVVLRGIDGTLHQKVRIKVDITGPATPKIMATDTSGSEHDIADIGYWGPAEGFPVQGTFENVTPIKATFTVAGTYTIKLSLINLEDNNAVIATKTETIEVLEDKSNVVNEMNNTVEKLPQTGTSIGEYMIYAGIIITIVGFGYYEIRKARV